MRGEIIRKNRFAMARSFKHSLLACGIALAASVLVAACGGTYAVGRNHTLTLAMTEYRLAPQRIQAPAGTLTIFVHNEGRLTHDLAVWHGAITEASTQPIPPGGRAVLQVALKRGTYLIDSTLLSDQDLGLYGTLVIK
jgi:hypothetical protein